MMNDQLRLFPKNTDTMDQIVAMYSCRIVVMTSEKIDRDRVDSVQ